VQIRDRNQVPMIIGYYGFRMAIPSAASAATQPIYANQMRDNIVFCPEAILDSDCMNIPFDSNNRDALFHCTIASGGDENLRRRLLRT